MTDFLDDIMSNDPVPQGKKIRYDFSTTFPSMEETLAQEKNGYADYTNDLKEHTYNQFVDLVKQMDISAHDTARQIIYMHSIMDGLKSHIKAKDEIIEDLESEKSRVRSAIKFLMGFANEDVTDDDSMDEE